MKLFIRDYLLSLKEDGELDQFIVRLLRELSIVSITTPQKGRQFGVDIAAIGPDFQKKKRPQTLFLFVVKQGNITRSNWDGKETDVRASLNEILDVYLPNHRPVAYKKLPVKIILVANGEIKQSVFPNWASYINQNSKRNLQYDFWGTDMLTELAEQTQFPESLFPENVFSLLRRTMTLLADEAYDYRHYYEMVEAILKTNSNPSLDEMVKKLRLLNSTYAMIVQLAIQEGNTKPAVVIGERMVLKVWEWITTTEKESQKEVVGAVIEILEQKVMIDRVYFDKVADSFTVENGLFFSGFMDENEYALTCFEQIGILATYGHEILWLANAFSGNANTFPRAVCHWNEAQVIAQALANLVQQNPGAWYPKLDEHCIEINMAMLLLLHTERNDEAKQWLNQLINYLYYVFRFSGFLPLFKTDYEQLANWKHAPGAKASVESSILITVLADWCVILKAHELYENLRGIVTENFPEVNLQIWFPDEETNAVICSQNALHTGSSKTSITLPENILEYEMEMAEERALFGVEREISFVKEGFHFIGMYAFRHFRTYVMPNYWRDWLNTSFCFNTQEKKEELPATQP